jgi:hypothetical protein
MKPPTFKNQLAWEQAQLLMQPAMLRVVDNIRKELEESDWRGDYKEVVEPIPGYHLCLTKQDKSIEIDIWELCYQVCFQDYYPLRQHIFSKDEGRTYEVEIDTHLFDENGELDWHSIEAKAQQSVREVFNSLNNEQ